MATLTDVFVALAPWLRAQFGLVTSRQAAEAGVSRQQLARAVDSGLLVRRFRGGYASVLHGDGYQHRAMTMQLRCGPFAALSFGVAARLLGLEQVRLGRTPPIEITFPRGRVRRAVEGIALHESIHLDLDRDTVRIGPFRLTCPAWTAAALCIRTDLGRAEKIVDAAIANRQASLAEFQELAERWWHTPGVVTLRAVLLRHVPQVALTRSEAERLFLRILRDAGLPLPQANVRVVDAAGRVRYLDFAYVELGIAIEIDLHRDHGRTIGRNADGTRQNDLVPAWLPLRFDEDDLRSHAADVADQVRRALIASGHPALA